MTEGEADGQAGVVATGCIQLYCIHNNNYTMLILLLSTVV